MRKYMEDAKPKILKCEDFHNNREVSKRSFSGRVVNNKNNKIVYVVYSYTTPIAFFIGKRFPNSDSQEYIGAWYMTRQRFSQTTSTQQSALHYILQGKTVLHLGTADFNELLRDASN